MNMTMTVEIQTIAIGNSCF